MIVAVRVEGTRREIENYRVIGTRRRSVAYDEILPCLDGSLVTVTRYRDEDSEIVLYDGPDGERAQRIYDTYMHGD